MLDSLPWFIGLRYVRARRRNHFISFISLASMIGIGLGVATLITVLSVMNGFETSLRERLLELTPHITLQRPRGGIGDWPKLARTLVGKAGVTSARPYTEAKGLLKNGMHVKGVQLRGLQPELETEGGFSSYLRGAALGSLKPGGFGILLGKELAADLHVAPGDRLTLVSLRRRAHSAELTSDLERVEVLGLLDTGMYDIDSTLALMHLDDVAHLLHMEGRVTGLNLTLADPYRARQTAEQLRSGLIGYWVSDWSWRHSNFFRALHSQKLMMFFIFSLIVAVAAFNIVSTLVMVVNDKRRDIAVLRTLGLTPGRVTALFIVQGSIIGLFGTVLGVGLGLALALNVDILVPALERLLNADFLPGDVYPITELSGEVRWADLSLIAATSFVLALLATLYPARRAARTAPARALRYE
jgi:lipoprotein-releasing system permease protein